MKKFIPHLFRISTVIFLFITSTFAQNPIIRNQFTADPTARVFNGKVYVFPSHDILAVEGKGRPGWFCMEDYHVFSSSDLTDWTDHGVIVSQNKVNWADSAAYSMWAPDCIEKNGKYYFYFPAIKKEIASNGRKGFSIGVALANQPEGPYIPQPEAIKNVRGIDPNVFIDKDGQAYLYWSMGKIFVAKLKDNMLELASDPQEIKELPEVGLKEGPFLFERKGIYYMTYPHVQNKIERLEYATGDNPIGPFKFAGVVMDESPMNCWTNHQSFIEYKDQWYLFYHQNEYSPKLDKNRSICSDSLFFNADGTIRKVTPTFRGVGLTDALNKIEIDRYSFKSNSGTLIALLDTLDSFKGWKALIDKKNAWIQYNGVNFGKTKIKSIVVKAFSKIGSTLQVRLNSANGPVIAKVNVPKGENWQTIKVSVLGLKPGVQNLVVSLIDKNPVEVDWISFE